MNIQRIIFCLLAVAIDRTFAAVTPFTVQGFLKSISASGTAFNSGGRITVNGFDIQVPDNLLVDLPALAVPFKDFAAGDRAGNPANEVLVTGNIVDGNPIAGQVRISQLLGQISNGYIQSLGFDGAIKIVDGPTIRINDPNAVFSSGYTKLPLFTADDENPSITSVGGFPMCVPRSDNDPKCPQSNRPTNVANPLNYFVPDPLHMAPLKVGDYITYSGVEVGTEIICYSIIANIGIITAPGVAPGFIAVEEALIGILDPTNRGLEDARSRFVGFCTDPSTTISIWAIDIDPCTGTESERLMGFTFPEPLVNGRAKWKFETAAQPVGFWTRSYRLKLSSGQKDTTDGILGGQFVQPVLTWVFPEVFTPGATAPPLDFSNIAPLANGFGPDVDGNVFHQLNPWPGATAPVPISVCPDHIKVASSTSTSSTSTLISSSISTSSIASPTSTSTTSVPTSLTANAGPDQLVRGGTAVTLTASQSAPGFSPADLSFTWTQTSGPTTGLKLTGAGTSALTFTVPVLAATDPTTVARVFSVTITHKPSGTKSTDTVTVTADKVSVDSPVIDSFTWVAGRLGGTLTLTTHTNLVLPAGASGTQMEASIGGLAPVVMNRVGGSPGHFTLTQRQVSQPNNVTVVSVVGGVRLTPGTTKIGLTKRDWSIS